MPNGKNSLANRAVPPLLGLLLLLLTPTTIHSAENEKPTLTTSTRAVVCSIVRASVSNNRSAAPLLGDALTDHLIRIASKTASHLPEKHARKAYLLGLGIALDHSSMLQTHSVMSRIVPNVESKKERAHRLEVLGKPTLRGRRDWLQHFVVSAALTAVVGANLAESAGVLKEQRDMSPDGSGFSFADLAVDLAGVEFARRVLSKKTSCRQLSEAFTTKGYVPHVADLPESLTREQFQTRYGGVGEPRYRALLASIRRRIRTNGEK